MPETLNWTLLGTELRASALDAHEGELPEVECAYSFLLENPECFAAEGDDWPADMPQQPNIELIAAYYAEVPRAEFSPNIVGLILAAVAWLVLGVGYCAARWIFS